MWTLTYLPMVFTWNCENRLVFVLSTLMGDILQQEKMGHCVSGKQTSTLQQNGNSNQLDNHAKAVLFSTFYS